MSSARLCAVCALSVIFAQTPWHVRAQPATEPSLSPHVEGVRSARFWPGIVAFAAADAAAMVWLSGVWYTGHETTRFHWYGHGSGWEDDWNSYVQQDKLGHMLTAWQMARAFGAFGRWSGMTRRQAGLFGAAASTVFQLQIEVLDGFSAGYGASRTDILANTVGAALGGAKTAFTGPLSWFTVRYSYRPSPYYDRAVSSLPPLRYVGNAIQDYDGASFWLVLRPPESWRLASSGCLGERTECAVGFWQRWPDWLGIAIGYGGSGLAYEISGRAPPDGQAAGPHHRRELFIGPDFDLFARRSQWPQPFRAIGDVLSFLRLPAPALQLTPVVRWHFLYY